MPTARKAVGRKGVIDAMISQVKAGLRAKFNVERTRQAIWMLM
jgi:hypothetical protein